MSKPSNPVEESARQLCAQRQGCNGGDQFWTMRSVQSKFGGLPPYSADPYTISSSAAQAGSCPYPTPSSLPAGSASWVSANQPYAPSEDLLMQLLQTGPVSISINVENAFNYYTGGVYTTACSTDPSTTAYKTNHAVLAVGYGTDAATGLPFWKIKASSSYNLMQTRPLRV